MDEKLLPIFSFKFFIHTQMVWLYKIQNINKLQVKALKKCPHKFLSKNSLYRHLKKVVLNALQNFISKVTLKSSLKAPHKSSPQRLSQAPHKVSIISSPRTSTKKPQTMFPLHLFKVALRKILKGRICLCSIIKVFWIGMCLR